MEQTRLRPGFNVQKVSNFTRTIGFVVIGFAILANPFVLGSLLSQDGVIASLQIISIIVFCELLILSFGLILTLKPNASVAFIFGVTKKEIFLLMLAFSFAFLVGEIILHMTTSPVYPSTQYGWNTQEHHTDARTIHDRPGHFRNVKVTYLDHGFKRWGDVARRGPKVMILGDSFTQMTFVSNGEEWYAALEKAFPETEFFVKGVDGFGTLQEYLILDDYIDEIDPDLILWQFCKNDYSNNSYEMDIKKYPYNNFGVRPYFEQGLVVNRMTVPFSFLRKYSRFSDLLLVQYDIHMRRRAQELFRLLCPGSKCPKSEQILPEAYEVTGNILKMVRERAGVMPFFMFSSNRMTKNEITLCQKSNITCIPGVFEYLEEKEADGTTVGVVDNGHWNLAGNAFVGEYLVKYFKKNSVISEQS